MSADVMTKEQLRSQIIRGLLTSKRQLTSQVLRRKADIAGLQLACDYQIYSIMIGNQSTSIAMLVAAMRAKYDSQQDVIVLVEGEIFCITRVEGVKRAKSMTIGSLTRFFNAQGVQVSIAASCVHHSAENLALAIEEVKQARLVGEKIWPGKTTYLASEMGIYIGLMPDIKQGFRKTVASRLVTPLLNDKILLQTVEIFLQTSLNVTDAARRLKVHRNTLLYRLDKVKKLTSFDVTKFEDALHIKLGLLIVLGNELLY